MQKYNPPSATGLGFFHKLKLPKSSGVPQTTGRSKSLNAKLRKITKTITEKARKATLTIWPYLNTKDKFSVKE